MRPKNYAQRTQLAMALAAPRAALTALPSSAVSFYPRPTTDSQIISEAGAHPLLLAASRNSGSAVVPPAQLALITNQLHQDAKEQEQRLGLRRPRRDSVDGLSYANEQLNLEAAARKERQEQKRRRILESNDDTINSDLDDTDEEDNEDQEGIISAVRVKHEHDPTSTVTAMSSDWDPKANMILCTYEKVHRTKNRWKCFLKDGVLTLNGKDYLFQKAQCDFQW